MSVTFMAAVKARVEARRAVQYRHYATTDRARGKLVSAAMMGVFARQHEQAAHAMRDQLTADQWAGVEQLLAASY
jgi:hypothetical protein